MLSHICRVRLGMLGLVLAFGCDGGPADVPTPTQPGSAVLSDLSPVAVEAPGQIRLDSLLQLRVAVHNGGTRTAGPGWFVRLFLSADSLITPDDLLIDQFVASRELQPGADDRYGFVNWALVNLGFSHFQDYAWFADQLLFGSSAGCDRGGARAGRGQQRASESPHNHHPAEDTLRGRLSHPMEYAREFIRELEIPRAEVPLLQHLVDTYASETNKLGAVWSELGDTQLDFRPHGRSSSIRQILVHQILSERRFFGEFIGLSEPAAESLLPEGPAPPASAYLERVIALARARLPALAAADEKFWLAEVPFFDVRRQRIWVFWRRVLHTAHHRAQVLASTAVGLLTAHLF